MIRLHDDREDDRDDPVDRDYRWRDNLEECSRCGHLVYTDSERCPRCGKSFSRKELPATTSQPLWVKLTALVCLFMMLHWIWRLVF